ncbi:hypothetical protein ACSFCT_26445, partial [Yokenella regensburgei]
VVISVQATVLTLPDHCNIKQMQLAGLPQIIHRCVMVVINNFREVEATPEQIDLFATSGFIPKFLRSEDGQDWYECQSQFSYHTVKIMFDSKGIVR